MDYKKLKHNKERIKTMKKLIKNLEKNGFNIEKRKIQLKLADERYRRNQKMKKQEKQGIIPTWKVIYTINHLKILGYSFDESFKVINEVLAEKNLKLKITQKDLKDYAVKQ